MAKLVSIQQAAANAVVAYLANAVNNPLVYPKPDEQVKFEPRWPDPTRALPHRAVTLTTAGARTNGNDPVLGWWHASQDVTAQYPALPTGVRMFRWSVAWYEQPVQLDIWSLSWDDRDDIVARLDIALHAGPGESQSYSPSGYPVGDPVVDYLLIPLTQSDGWPGAYCGAYFTDNGPQLIDTPLSAQRTMFRALWPGTLEMLLTVDAPSFQMAKIKFEQQRSDRGSLIPFTAPDLVTNVTPSGVKITTS